jgi:hypothetical protein
MQYSVKKMKDIIRTQKILNMEIAQWRTKKKDTPT